MSDNQIEEVKSKTDIVSLLSEYLELKKAGRNYKTNCPFHGEKTPSFMISPELQMYKCFGCGKSGDVFTFLEEHEGMEFGEALKYLADRLGITLTSFKTSETSEREKILEINKNALQFYDYVLMSHPKGKRALDYLTKERELDLETIKLFKIGYSPDDFNALHNYLTQKKKIKEQDLSKSGLMVGRGIDRFRGRVIFPLMDHRDNIVGFAGRILPWVKQDAGKYINSPDTPAYHKSKILYGLNISKSYIRDLKYAVVVEGELDMISSFRAGIKNVIAIKGSVLTEDQIRLIGRFAQKIVLCLDSDFAGDEAAKRGAISASNLGFEVTVARLEGFKDPDEIARKSPDNYKKAIENALPIWDFLINVSVEKNGLSDGEDKKKISSEITPILASIEDRIVQAHYIEILARKLSVPVEAVTEEVNKKNKYFKEVSDSDSKIQTKDRSQLLEEKLLINLLLKDPTSLLKSEIQILFSTTVIKKIVNEVQNYLRKNDNVKEFDLNVFGKLLPGELQKGFAEIVLENPETEDTETLIKELTILSLKHKLEVLSVKIREDEDNEDYLKEFSEISQKLSTL